MGDCVSRKARVGDRRSTSDRKRRMEANDMARYEEVLPEATEDPARVCSGSVLGGSVTLFALLIWPFMSEISRGLRCTMYDVR